MQGFTFDYLLSDPNYKMLIDEDTVGAVKTTYIGKADYISSWTALTSEAKRQIIRLVETTTGVDIDTERSIPVSLGVLSTLWQPSTLTEFIRDNRATLTYV